MIRESVIKSTELNKATASDIDMSIEIGASLEG